MKNKIKKTCLNKDCPERKGEECTAGEVIGYADTGNKIDFCGHYSEKFEPCKICSCSKGYMVYV